MVGVEVEVLGVVGVVGVLTIGALLVLVTTG